MRNPALNYNNKANIHLQYASNEDKQPSHYLLDPEVPESTTPKLRAVGEFEIPDLNEELDNLHQIKTEKQKPLSAIGSFLESNNTYKFMERAMNIANGLNIATSGVTAVGSAISRNDSVTNGLQKLASVGAKLSMGVNSMFNILNGHKKRDLANVLGYLGELAVAAFAPYKILGLLRGVTFSTYQTSNILSSVKAMEGSKTYGDYINQVKERLPILAKKIIDPKTYANLSDNAGFITGGWGSLLSYTGVLGWAATGSTKFGGWVKGFGELLVDSYQVLTKDHWLRKKQFYIGSGIAFIMGSLCEIISKQRDNDPVTMALYFFGSGIGRMFYTFSNIAREDEYEIGGPKGKNANNVFDFTKILNFNKLEST